MINDFIYLFHYLNDFKKEVNKNKDINISEDSNIYEVLK